MNCMDGWVSPVELIYEDAKNRLLKQTDEFIMARCESVLGVKVDKDELIKAMHYDREQYKKGFANGYKQRENEIVRCKVCAHYQKAPKGFVYGSCDYMHGHIDIDENDFCSLAERKEEKEA